MQMKCSEPAALNAARLRQDRARKPVNSTLLISPEAIGNGRWWIAPRPLAWPSIGTLYGGSMQTIAARSAPIRAVKAAVSRALPHKSRFRPRIQRSPILLAGGAVE